MTCADYTAMLVLYPSLAYRSARRLNLRVLCLYSYHNVLRLHPPLQNSHRLPTAAFVD